MMSGRFVAAMMYTSLRPSIPSISVRSWLTTLKQAGHAKHEQLGRDGRTAYEAKLESAAPNGPVSSA